MARNVLQSAKILQLNVLVSNWFFPVKPYFLTKRFPAGLTDGLTFVSNCRI